MLLCFWYHFKRLPSLTFINFFCFTASVLVPRADMREVSSWLLQCRTGEWMNIQTFILCDSFICYFHSTFMSYRKRFSWMARSSSPCCGAHVRWHTVISRSSKLTRFSTWLSGSCVSSHAHYHGPQCCVYGTCSSVKVPLKSMPAVSALACLYLNF